MQSASTDSILPHSRDLAILGLKSAESCKRVVFFSRVGVGIDAKRIDIRYTLHELIHLGRCRLS